MKDHRGISSRVEKLGGVPTLFVNGEPFAAAAYMTYLGQNSDCAAFARAGYRLFSVPVLFAGRWIAAQARLRPFGPGIFDRKGAAVFTEMDEAFSRIVSACPDALIFPRLNLSMPAWWIEENPDELDGTGERESLFSEKFRETAAEMLRKVIKHINGSDHVSHIVGLQIAGGNTEEWFHFDLNAGRCARAEKAFDAYLDKNRPGCGFRGLPPSGDGEVGEHLRTYLEFANESVADLIAFFCREAKEATGGDIAVGTFYGYSLEVATPLFGTHALGKLLGCGDVDFICSPNSYINTRATDADWTEMYPADSVRLSGKLCMQECDIRTHLTRPLSESPGYEDAGERYSAPIWQPLGSREAAIDALRKTFCRQLVKGNGFWWFDMWGGWYRDSIIMDELAVMRGIYEDSLAKENRGSVAELAVFVDESAYYLLPDCPFRGAAFRERIPLGELGVPYDMYDVFDLEKVKDGYKAFLFLSDAPTRNTSRALRICEEESLPFLCLTESEPFIPAGRLREFCRENGAHVWCETDDIIYVNNNYIAVHANTDGEKILRLTGSRPFRELLTRDGLTGEGDMIVLTMRRNETRLFEMTE